MYLAFIQYKTKQNKKAPEVWMLLAVDFKWVETFHF